MRFRAHSVVAATGGRLVGPDVEIDGVSFDSRSVKPGQLFVPLVADRDGHEFIDQAIERGAAAYLTSRPPVGGTAIEVPDTLPALMALATSQRRMFDGPVIGITGSVGKTSTKDLAWAALAASIPTWANERSFNNEQGLPTTLLNTPDGTKVLMLEMGMRALGEITELCAIAQPTIGVVTRVAEAHSDRVGGIDGVARAKAELIQALPADGLAILNADDARVRAMEAVCAGSVLLYGETADADVRVSMLRLDDLARASFHLDTPWGSYDVRLAISGRHMANNAAAALACVGAVGGDLVAGAQALSTVGLTAMRMDVRRTSSGAVVLDDSYNANPTSMRAALDALADLTVHRRIAVLGVMAEISDSEAEHLAIAAYATQRGIELIAYGTDLYGVAPNDDPIAALGSIAGGDAVLVKGSRVVGLERIAAALLG
ncbi:MAG TPA: UDP-N-acetylmuramoyl-tripeptide--D-alanyl-D-alanine ligase [Ilumatobacteraceae bacterium]|nr:UDP-N-acetylmuramoyl-tripeptide--D-alanyl-D-alanine ligase [Ilumatobacteraceae bacterium]HRB03314.1 UDP-N-acetylmuramoyl-tripeptide--D-alanyl-D-alanine ligase [Ilumatobacteraceae bacterium]